jgi:leucyl aminopeptidase
MSYSSLHARAQAAFDPAPSIEDAGKSRFRADASIPKNATCVGTLVTEDGKVPGELGPDRAALRAAGFKGKIGEAMVIPRKDGPLLVVVGAGRDGKLDANALRDAAAAFARATSEHTNLALLYPETSGAPAAAAQAIAEGVLLGRYRYAPLKQPSDRPARLAELTVVSSSVSLDEIKRGLERGGITSRAVELARDLANAPAALLTARRMAEIAESLAKVTGLEVEMFDEEQLSTLGCGGLLGVNAGSAEPPRMIKLTYRPAKANGKASRIALVAKGIMYDSGGISLKPGDEVHAQMKNDMSGAGAVFAAMTALKALDCPHTVIGFLMCTDNMPSGTAMKMGDVLTVRGGKTVEVNNTDAEGRLVMSDGLVLSTELDPKPDAILDIATLTGAAMRTFGVLTAAVMGNHPQLIEQVEAAAERTDETVWQLPLDHRLRKELDSVVADIKNLGGANAGSITAGLFLEEFVACMPWVHIDMCGTAHSATDLSWRAKGMTGYGARLLIEFLVSFKKPALVH